ncbi:CG9673 [Drosophila busckii]|uniref:trypsin n=1 Tax=Drosophila busckii TaxID=30019 RepID=A0A0M4EMH8_DROBS|nr:chymotrypsin-1 [Drosophila busckii]ALC48946.1 CG9673 [Drosophila busckii]
MLYASRLTLATLCALALLQLAPALPQSRILGGEDAAVAEFPWVASLRLNKAHICSACIISTTQLLTAAHCVSDMGTKPVAASALTARVGSVNQFAGGSLVDVSEVLIHPSYGNFLHDVAIITLSKPLTFGEKISKVALPEQQAETEPEELAHGTPVYGSGWGEQLDGTASYKLQKANFNTVSSQMCELEAGYGYDSVLCLSSAEKQGVCRGDDGAGIIDDNKVLQGIVSFHFGSCGTKTPDVAARISYYAAWILSNAK